MVTSARAVSWSSIPASSISNKSPRHSKASEDGTESSRAQRPSLSQEKPYWRASHAAECACEPISIATTWAAFSVGVNMSPACGQGWKVGRWLVGAGDMLNGGARLIGRLAAGCVAIIAESVGSATILFDQRRRAGAVVHKMISINYHFLGEGAHMSTVTSPIDA